MKINDFLKKIASDIKKSNQEYTVDDYYYLLKYSSIKKDESRVQDIETFYASFLDNLNNSLVRHVVRKTGKDANTTHYLGFYIEERANYTEAYKVYFPVKYEYMISALKTVFSYLIRNSIASTLKFHVKATNENIVIRFYHKEDVLPFINYCNNNFVLEELLEPVNPFIATIYGMGLLQDDNTINSYNGTLALALKDYFSLLKIKDTLDKASDIHFLDFLIQRQEIEENEIIKFDLNAIIKNIKAILTQTSPID